MINEKMRNNERSTDQPPHNVAWEGDVYSKVLGNNKSGYVRGLEQEIIELKEKQNEEMNLMKQNHEKLQSELLLMRQFMQKYAPNESLPQDINGTSNEKVPDHNSGKKGVPRSSKISSNAEIILPHGYTI